jgi:hypothetical protein
LFYLRGMTSIPWPPTVAFTATAAVFILVLTGCAPEELRVSDAPADSSGPPPFTSTDDALAAAQATYEGYLAASDIIMSEGGANPERLDEFVTPEVAQIEQAGFEDLASRGHLLEGRAIIDSISLQSYSPGSSSDVVSAYVCVDVRNVDVVDADGLSVVESTRAERSAFQVTFDLDPSTDSRLRVASNYAWAGEGVC